jgi:hypothetical protein
MADIPADPAAFSAALVGSHQLALGANNDGTLSVADTRFGDVFIRPAREAPGLIFGG